MSRVISIVLLFFLLGLSNAYSSGGNKQNKIEYKYSTEPFSEKLLSSGTGFHGNDPVTLIDEISKNPAPVKSQFETQSDFESRLDKWMSKSLVGGIYPTSMIALGGFVDFLSDDKSIVFSYDAEEQRFAFTTFNPRCGRSVMLGMKWRVKTKSTGSYVGTNAFGVKNKINSFLTEMVCVNFVSNEIDVGNQLIDYGPANLAESALMFGNFFVVGRLAPPYIWKTKEHRQATINDPEEIFEITTTIYIKPEAFYVVLPNNSNGPIWLKVSPIQKIRF